MIGANDAVDTGGGLHLGGQVTGLAAGTALGEAVAQGIREGSTLRRQRQSQVLQEGLQLRRSARLYLARAAS
jgi:hypothetical protein